MKRRWIWYCRVHYQTVKRFKAVADQVEKNEIETTIVGESREEAESLSTFQHVINNIRSKVGDNKEIEITEITFIKRLSKTMYEV